MVPIYLPANGLQPSRPLLKPGTQKAVTSPMQGPDRPQGTCGNAGKFFQLAQQGQEEAPVTGGETPGVQLSIPQDSKLQEFSAYRSPDPGWSLCSLTGTVLSYLLKIQLSLEQEEPAQVWKVLEKGEHGREKAESAFIPPTLVHVCSINGSGLPLLH